MRWPLKRVWVPGVEYWRLVDIKTGAERRVRGGAGAVIPYNPGEQMYYDFVHSVPGWYEWRWNW